VTAERFFSGALLTDPAKMQTWDGTCSEGMVITGARLSRRRNGFDLPGAIARGLQDLDETDIPLVIAGFAFFEARKAATRLILTHV